ncbi:DEAD/DEAH box helicase [Paraburkholderia xenovorans]|uniref:DEAD/DEAH box helicase n=1 Tax=Paraburkholderia xenovorans TaxID=36873 RepID=UPI0038B801F8
MDNKTDVIPADLTAQAVRSYIDFDGHDAARTTPSAQAVLQSEGVAALWHLLQSKSFAYLADEVGMGKTRQAMGIIATQFLRKPDSRVVIVCSSATLQRQWQSEWSEFLRTCYKLLDNRLLSAAAASPLENLHFHHSLRDFVKTLSLGDARIHLMRYSSFSRPLTFTGEDSASILEEYRAKVGAASTDDMDHDESAIPATRRKLSKTEKDDLTHALSAAYCRRIGALMTGGSRRENDESMPNQPLDLVIFDEAQYLRHTGNFQNSHIAAIFRRNVERWLFMSATPLHSSMNDIRSLDTYLCRKPLFAGSADDKRALEIPRDCGTCNYQESCSRINWQLHVQPEGKRDVVPLLPTFMVRRTRTYADSKDTRYGKIQYRKYERIRYTGADDPFLSLTMSLVQKRLVGALAGKGNKFRLGECASFESLSTSVGRTLGFSKQVTPEPVAEREYEALRDTRQRTQDDEPGVAFDRTVIDDLNRDFESAMNALNESAPGAPHAARRGFALPHAKLNRTADALFEHSLKDASCQKTLVFVRRIDTVEEIRDLLNTKFQQQMDRRIETWRTQLMGPAFGTQGKSPWIKDEFWETEHVRSTGSADEEIVATERKADEDAERESLEQSDEGLSADEPRGTAYKDALRLPYFEALKRARKGGDHGMLVSFGSRLLSVKDASRNPLRGFLLKRPPACDEVVSDANESHWRNNAKRWRRFLEIVLGDERLMELRAEPGRQWLFGNAAENTVDAWKLAALQLCVLQSIRQTDFLVDLYILHTHVARTPTGETELPDKLLWLLETDPQCAANDGLAGYIGNWNERFRRWIEHFDLIVDKCMRSGAAVDWAEIYRERVHLAFRQMSPVIGRSSRLRNQNAVTQFKFPTYPNVLICTDVLKEGVDMHLFCDNIVHYGVAWTSGDLEQRIGRIDRLGSLIGRRIERFASTHCDSSQDLPRLGVAFPYLDGTLDRFQVERVIQAKIVSDLRMDLGKLKDEIGELSLATFDDESIQVAATNDSPQSGAVFFPESAKPLVAKDAMPSEITLPDGIRGKSADDTVRSVHAADENALESAEYLPAFNCVRVRRRASLSAEGGRVAQRTIDTGAGVLRLSRSGAKEADIVCTEEILVPGTHADARSLSAALSESEPSSVRRTNAEGFALDPLVKTATRVVDMSHALLSRGQGSSKVILESVGGDFWLLRTAVCAAAAAIATADGRNLPRWLATKNRDRRWGYLMVEAGIVWFAVVVSDADSGEQNLLTRFSAEMGRIALYYRSTVNDPEQYVEKEYRASASFPTLAALSQSYGGDADLRVSRLLKTLSEGHISGMMHDDFSACGSVLAGVQAWFIGAFNAVLDALCETEDGNPQHSFKVTPLAFLDGGILHLCAEGKEHFRIQAYLDLNDAMGNENVISGPKMVWELAASPIVKGPKPTLPLSRYEELPHVLRHAWEGEIAEGAAAFTCKGDKYRFVTLYHHPAAWDRARTDLLEAWQTVRTKMQALTNFQRKGCRDTLIQAVGPTRAV